MDDWEIVRVTPGSELDLALARAGGAAVRLVRNGTVYRVVEEGPEDIWAGYNPEAVRAALRQTAGSWAEADTSRLIADLYRWREEGSRPASRPYDWSEKFSHDEP